MNTPRDRSAKGSVVARVNSTCVFAVCVLVIISLAQAFAQGPTNCVTPPSGLVAWWPGDGTTFDVAGANHGTLQNGASFAPGMAGQAFSFDGVNDEVIFPDNANLTFGTNSLSVAVWARADSLTPNAYHTIACKRNTGGDGTGWWLGRTTEGNWRVALRSGASGVNAYSDSVATTGQYVHLVFVVDRGTNTLSLYLNGTLQTNHPSITTIGTLSSSHPIRVGAEGDHPNAGTPFPFRGVLDELQVFNRALSSNEVAAIHAAGSSGICYTNDPAPVFVQQPQSQIGVVADSATLTGMAMGSPRPTYQWLFNDTPLQHATNNSLILANLTLTDSGDYTLLASNIAGVVTSTVARLTVKEFGAYWDSSVDYSWHNNPNGVWAYGRKWSVTSQAFDPMTVRWGDTGWYLGNWGHGGPSVAIGPQMWAKNNSNGYPDTRWTCPKSGIYKIKGQFIGSDSRGVDNHVYVVINGTNVFTGRISAYLQAATFSITPVFLERGAVVDFVLVWAGGVYSEYGWTDLDAVISSADTGVMNSPESFENGWGDWYSAGPVLWQIRPPANGPITAFQGTNAACGNVGGNYPAGVNSRLISPRFTVPAVNPGEVVTLRFQQWYQYGAGDTGLVKISVGAGINWFPWETLAVAATNGASPGWQQQIVDLSQYQGQRVRLGFLHAANSDGSVGAGWYLDDIELSAFVPTPLGVGVTVTNHFAGSGARVFYVLQAPSGGHLRLTLDDLDNLGVNELYVRYGALPSAGVYDYRFSTLGGADQQVFVPNAQSGPWYVMAYADSAPGTGDFTLQTEFFTGIVLLGCTPTHLGNAGPASIDIDGAGFDSSAQVSLVNGGFSLVATNVSFVSASRLVADFDLTGLPANTYQLTVSQDTNSVVLPFEVTQAIGPKLEANLIVPSQVGRNTLANLYFEYKNTGDSSMPAPLFVLTGSQNAKLTIKPEDIVPDFYTSAQPRDANDVVQIFGNGQTLGVLQPGETVRVPIKYLGLTGGGNPSINVVQFTAGFVRIVRPADPPEPAIDWNSLKSQMRPPSIPTDAWDALWQNFTSAAGNTWSSYQAMLRENTTYLGRLGIGNYFRPILKAIWVGSASQVSPSHVGDMLAFEFAQADGLHIVRFLASSTDGFAPTPGLRLSFERVFPNRITGRYQVGALGRGWSHNWDTRLDRAGDGTVTVIGPAGARRTFKPDSRGGWFNDLGDYAKLTALSGGAYSLCEKDGLLRIFRSDGKLDYIQDPNSTRITCGYSSGLLTSLTHSSGQSLQLTYSGGRIAAIIDVVGRQTVFTYSGDHLTSTRYFDGSVVSYSYASGQGITREHALTEIAYPGGTHEYFSYTAQGRLDRMSRDGDAEAVTFSFDNAGLINATDAFGNNTKFFLDHRGLLAKVENPKGSTMRLNYDNQFNLTGITDPEGHSYTYAYDSIGNLIDATDPLGSRTRFAYEGPFYRLAMLLDDKGNPTRYSHSAQGNLTAITYANDTVERWSYDASGNPTTWTNRRGQGITYQFNTNGQLTAKLYPDGSRAAYDYDARGNLVLASNYTGAITLAYDADDRLQRITYPSNRWLEYTYNAVGQRASMTDQLGYRLDYDYDAVGRLRSITNSAGIRIVLYEYDIAGRLARKTLGNGVYTTYGYDRAGQLLTLTNAKPDHTALSFFNYTYDSRGRRTAMATHYGVWTYEYDDLGQLTHAVLASTDPQIPSQDLRYEYDAMGNRVQTVENGVATEYAVNNMNQYSQIGRSSLVFDSDGNMIQWPAPPIGGSGIFDFENRLVRITIAADTWLYSYDAFGSRVSTSNYQAELRFVIDPTGLGNLVGAYGEAGGLIMRYDYALGLVAQANSTGNAAFYTSDAVGSIYELVSSSGSVQANYAYEPFGRSLMRTDQYTNAFTYVGRQGVADDASGFQFMRHRFYDVGTGRFVSPDPINLKGEDVNLYRYVRNSPVGRSDPSGLRWWIGEHRGPGIHYHIFFDKPVTIFGKPISDIGFFPKDPLEDWSGTLLTGENPNDYYEWAYDEMGQGDDLMARAIEDVGTPDNWVPIYDDCGTWVMDVLQRYYELENLDTGDSTIPRARDPNVKTGAAGYGPQNFVRADNLLPYTIHFENETNATAPAQQVVLSDRLTNTLDWTTFELTEIAFGDHFIALPAGSQHYEHTEHMTYSNVSFDVQIEAGIHLDSGEVYARFQSLDPTNGLPPPVEIGFLPPEDGTGRGQGHISYVVRPHADLVTGTEIRNVATIKFDVNEPIATDWKDPHDPLQGIDTNKQALVTIDADAPTSSVSALPASAPSREFTVSWSGTDTGSGISGYDIHVSSNDGPWMLWLNNTAGTSALFSGYKGTLYAFYSVAHDGAGNIQSTPTNAQTSTTTPLNSPPSLAPISNYFIRAYQTLVITNTAGDVDIPPQTLTFSLAQAPQGASIDLTNGIFQWTPACAQGSTSNRIIVRVTDDGTPARQSATYSFWVTVYECVEASLGRTIVYAGESNSVPIYLLSTVELTNLYFHVLYPPERFTNFSIQADAHPAMAPLASNVACGQCFICFTYATNEVLHGPTNVGTLCFQTIAVQTSAFVTLPVIDVDGYKPNGKHVAKAYGQPGRVVVLGQEPLLETYLPTNSRFGMILYGRTGTTNIVLSTPRLLPQADWTTNTTWGSIVLTNLFRNLPVIIPTNRSMFYRAVKE